MSTQDPIATMSAAIDQAGALLADVGPGDLDKPTPCAEWTVRDLGRHLAIGPGRFLTMAKGDPVDWSVEPTVTAEEIAPRFSQDAGRLLEFWRDQPDEAAVNAGFNTAEFAVHAWDLHRALGSDRELDEGVAEAALTVMRQGLTDENREGSFGPARDVPDDAPVYDRLAAWAGRDPGFGS